MSVVASLGTYLILSRGCSAGSESGIQPRVNYVSKISSTFGTRYIFSYVPSTRYPFKPVATYRSTIRWQSEHQLGHHYRNAAIPCVKEARWGRHEAHDSIVLSMSNNLLCSGAQHDTHTHIPEPRRGLFMMRPLTAGHEGQSHHCRWRQQTKNYSLQRNSTHSTFGMVQAWVAKKTVNVTFYEFF
jgi:hypothetical protein